jgi:hypothetical protein
MTTPEYDFNLKMLKEYGTQFITDAVEEVRGHCVWVDRDDIGDLLAVALEAAQAAQKLIDELPEPDDKPVVKKSVNEFLDGLEGLGFFES